MIVDSEDDDNIHRGQSWIYMSKEYPVIHDNIQQCGEASRDCQSHRSWADSSQAEDMAITFSTGRILHSDRKYR